jgi:hypothetical protein
MDFKFIEGEPPEYIHYQSKWMPIYLKFKDVEVGKWLGVEVPANKAGNIFGGVGQYLRSFGISLQMKIDKTNKESGVVTIWLRKLEAKEPKEIQHSDISIRGKGMKIVDVTDTNYIGEGVEPLRVVRVKE